MESSSLTENWCVLIPLSQSPGPTFKISKSFKATDPFTFEFHSPAKRPCIGVGEVKIKIYGLGKIPVYNQLEGSEDL